METFKRTIVQLDFLKFKEVIQVLNLFKFCICINEQFS